MKGKTEAVKVVIRCRPLSKTEVAKKYPVVVNVDETAREITVINPENKDEIRLFTFDRTYGMTSIQENIFKETALPILESCLEGYNGTIFAYGQTGTGKTFTMDGDDSFQNRGIMPRTVDHIFDRIKESSQKKKYLVHASYLQLYRQQLNDLLDKQVMALGQTKKKIEIHERPDVGIYLTNISKFMIQDRKEMYQKLEIGKKNRKQAATLMNERSSRSHSIFMITIETSEEVDGAEIFRVGKLNMVDLAGSERQSKTQVSGDQLQNAIQINLSLSTLGLVIESLVNSKKTHIPYRDSILTRLLQDSLGGNTKTVMVANVGPASYNYDQTINTLKYANRAKSIQNKPIVNEDPKDALLRQFQEEIAKLREELAKEYNELGSEMEIENMPEGVVPPQLRGEIEDQIGKEREKSRRKFQEEKRKVMEQKNINEEQKNKLVQAIEEKQAEQEALKEKHEKNLKKLKRMEEKVLHGTELEEKAKLREKEWREAQEELERQRGEEDKLRKKLQDYKDQIEDMEKKYDNQREEIEDKTRRIKLNQKKLWQISQDNKEQDEEYAAVIEELQERRRILQKEHKLKKFILEYFVPEVELETLYELAMYNWETDNWEIPNIEFAGNRTKRKNPYEAYVPTPGEIDLDELIRQELAEHPNMFYIYTEEGPIREEEATEAQKAKANRKKNKAKKAK